MGIGTLRRYHDDSREVGLTPLPESAVDEAREAAAEEVGKAEELAHNDAVNAAAAKYGDALAASLAQRDDEELAGRVTEALEELNALLVKPTPEAEEPQTPPQTEVRGDPEGNEPEGDREPKVGEVDLHDAEAGAQVAAEAAADAGVPQASTDELGATHGGLEQPKASASTADWVAYAENDPNGAPFDLAARPGLRDDIAAHYIKG